MPRRTDHVARRRQLADALMRLAATQGLEAVSLRHVAAEAGVSTGMVQHYFRTKDEMMTFALDMVMRDAERRVTAEATAAGRVLAPAELVRTLMVQILPLDEPRRLEGHVTLAFLAYAAVKPAIAEGLRESSGHMRNFLADQIRAVQATGGTVPPVDPTHAATALLALVDGLGIHVLSGHYSGEEAVAVLDAHLGLLFGTTPAVPSTTPPAGAGGTPAGPSTTAAVPSAATG
ncbi:TetR family transcriptional regulator [Plantactinospora sp. BC1]|uniref:TetR/AcrR family transcriptional regulator n=1 Tax=Plantactinospora sp. BC1 TaxID=2108470 RepID=UPI000D16FAE1|nr:TetR family transcriptional regulator C-terminal domain-containing protein [Plantactinospora sp. BC1]AVT28698.1 TetR family transcriptional regulator [Plantactinospora sp. BC1]